MCGSGRHSATGPIVEGFETRVEARLFRQDPYQVRVCRECQLFFKTPAPSVIELADYYATLDSATFEAQSLFPTDRLALEMLRHLPRGSRILDYGCGEGRILARLAEHYECMGVEVNARAAQKARARGICLLDEREAFDGDAATYAAILMSDVFEHLISPLDTLKRAAMALAPGGQIILVTGLADAAPPRERIAEFWYFRIFGHLQMLSEKHLRWLCETLSLELVTKQLASHYVTPLATRLRQYVRRACYMTFRSRERRLLAAGLRVIPVLRRAEQWRCAPEFSCGQDHIVVALSKTR